MKIKRLLNLLLCLAAVSAGAEGSVVSDSIRGCYVRVEWQRGTEALRSDERFSYAFLCTNEAPSVIFYPKPEYLCRMTLAGPSGSNVPPTILGKSFGCRFLALTNYLPESLERRVGGSSEGVPRFQRLRPDVAAARELPALSDLFEVPEAGCYTLRCEFQVFEQTKRGTNFTYGILRFPPIMVPVVAVKRPQAEH